MTTQLLLLTSRESRTMASWEGGWKATCCTVACCACLCRGQGVSRRVAAGSWQMRSASATDSTKPCNHPHTLRLPCASLHIAVTVMRPSASSPRMACFFVSQAKQSMVQATTSLEELLKNIIQGEVFHYWARAQSCWQGVLNHSNSTAVSGNTGMQPVVAGSRRT